MSNLRLSYLQKVGGGGCLYRPSPHPKKWGMYPPHPPGIYASDYLFGWFTRSFMPDRCLVAGCDSERWCEFSFLPKKGKTAENMEGRGEAYNSVTFTLRRPYGGRRTPKSSDSCGCRRNSAVAAGPPYGESLCFTGRKGGRRIIARSYNFFHFYVRRRNLTRRSHAVDRTVAVRSPYGPLAGALRMP